MIWSVIKLIFALSHIVSATVCNAITWTVYFGWDRDIYQMYWTDKKTNIQYTYRINAFAWAFRVKRLADSAFDITNNQHVTDKK